jgi:hypothetical protein
VDPASLKQFVGEYRMPAALTRVLVQKKQLFLQVGTQPRKPLIPTAKNEFRDDEDNRYRFRKTDDALILEQNVAGQKASGKRIQLMPLTTDEKKTFVGDYFSEELEVFNKIKLRDGRLVMHYPKGEALLLHVADNDFLARPQVGPGFTMRFTRNAEGKVNGFLLSGDRIKNLRYRRARIELE